MTKYTPLWPHGDIEQVFEDIYVVRGSNITSFNEKVIQHSRNMTIVDLGGELSLINTVRLSEEALARLEAIGQVKHIVRIGAFHGRDDAFYLDRYGSAEYWSVAPSELHGATAPRTIHALDNMSDCPMAGGRYYSFEHSSPAEGYLYLPQHAGVLITCDSIKNWLKADDFFNEETAKNCFDTGEFAKARISSIWLNATGVQKKEFDALLALKFKHLISAHGEVLRETAHQDIAASIAVLT